MNKNVIYALIVVVLLGAIYYYSQNVTNTTDMTEETATTTEVVTETPANTVTPAQAQANAATAAQQARTSLGYPSSWPSDVPVYPNQTVKYTGGNNPQSGPTEASVVLTTPDTVATVVQFYLSGLQANGWTITKSGAGLANQVTFRATKAKRTVGGYVDRVNNKTTVTIGVNLGF